MKYRRIDVTGKPSVKVAKHKRSDSAFVFFNQVGESEMSNKKAITQRQRDERARRVAMGIAVIQRPLKFINARTNTVEVKNGVTTVVRSLKSEIAQRMARIGDGASVKQIAFGIL